MRTHVVDLMYSPLGHDGSGSHANIFNFLEGYSQGGFTIICTAAHCRPSCRPGHAHTKPKFLHKLSQFR